jgi:hypothetical protein
MKASANPLELAKSPAIVFYLFNPAAKPIPVLVIFFYNPNPALVVVLYMGVATPT